MTALLTPEVPAEVTAHAVAGEKFFDSEVSVELFDAAEAYLRAYAGSFDFLRDLAFRLVAHNRSLSTPQARGVLNCWVAEVRQNLPAATASATLPPSYPAANVALRDGLYTVVLDTDTHRTIRVRRGTEDAKDVQFVSFLSGSDNESDYTCCGYIKADTYRWVRRFSEQATANTALATAVAYLLAADEARRTDYGRAYALESGKCYRCNRTLTDPTSIELGIGPICRDKE